MGGEDEGKSREGGSERRGERVSADEGSVGWMVKEEERRERLKGEREE